MKTQAMVQKLQEHQTRQQEPHYFTPGSSSIPAKKVFKREYSDDSEEELDPKKLRKSNTSKVSLPSNAHHRFFFFGC